MFEKLNLGDHLVIAVPKITMDEALRVLDLTDAPSLTEDVIKKAYHKAALRNHPDHGGSQEKMKLVNEAFELLETKAPHGIGTTKFDWEASHKKYRDAARVVIEQLKHDFKPEVFSTYFKEKTGKEFTNVFHFHPTEAILQRESGSPSSAGVSATWTSDDKNTAFALRASVSLHDVVWPKPTLSGGENAEDIGFDLWIDTEIFHDNRKVKFKPRNWSRSQLKSVLYDPEELFPSKKIEKMLQGKEKARKFSKRDFILGISKKLDGHTSLGGQSEWAYIPLGKDKLFELSMWRSKLGFHRGDTMASWAPHTLRMKKDPHTQFRATYANALESEALLDSLHELQKRVQDESDGKVIIGEIQRTFKNMGL